MLLTSPLVAIGSEWQSLAILGFGLGPFNFDSACEQVTRHGTRVDVYHSIGPASHDINELGRSSLGKKLTL